MTLFMFSMLIFDLIVNNSLVPAATLIFIYKLITFNHLTQFWYPTYWPFFTIQSITWSGGGESSLRPTFSSFNKHFTWKSLKLQKVLIFFVFKDNYFDVAHVW